MDQRASLSLSNGPSFHPEECLAFLRLLQKSCHPQGGRGRSALSSPPHRLATSRATYRPTLPGPDPRRRGTSPVSVISHCPQATPATHPNGPTTLTVLALSRSIRRCPGASPSLGVWHTVPADTSTSRGIFAWPLRYSLLPDCTGCVPLPVGRVRAKISVQARTCTGRIRPLPANQ
jgi:hypothetical protein